MSSHGENLLLEDWMFLMQDSSGRKLSGTDIHVYGIVYSSSKHGAGFYCGSNKYLASRLRITEKTAQRSLYKLLQSGFVEVVKPNQCNQNNVIKYRVAEKAIERAQTKSLVCDGDCRG